MALRSFGKVTVTSAGTPVRVTANETTPTARVGVQSIFVQAPAGNSGTYIYVGNADMDKSTYEGVYAWVAKGTSASFEVSMAPAGLNAAEIYIDADTTNDVALVSAVEQ